MRDFVRVERERERGKGNSQSQSYVRINGVCGIAEQTILLSHSGRGASANAISPVYRRAVASRLQTHIMYTAKWLWRALRIAFILCWARSRCRNRRMQAPKSKPAARCCFCIGNNMSMLHSDERNSKWKEKRNKSEVASASKCVCLSRMAHTRSSAFHLIIPFVV